MEKAAHAKVFTGPDKSFKRAGRKDLLETGKGIKINSNAVGTTYYYEIISLGFMYNNLIQMKEQMQKEQICSMNFLICFFP